MKTLFFILLLSSAVFAEVTPKYLRSFNVPFDGHIVAVSPNFQFVAISFGLDFAVFDLRRETEILRTQSGRSQESYSRTSRAVAFTPDSDEVLVGHEDGFLESINLTTRNRTVYGQISQQPLVTLNIARSPGQESQLLSLTDGALLVHGYPSLQLRHAFGIAKSHAGYLRGITALHPDATYAAFADHVSETTQIYDLAKGQIVVGRLGRDRVRGLFSELSFSTANNTLSMLFQHQPDELYWTETYMDFEPESVGTFQAFPLATHYNSFSQSGRRLLVGDLHYGCATILERQKGFFTVSQFYTLGSRNYKTSVAISPDGHFGITLTSDVLDVWEFP